jgi:hypothetical protein
MDLEGTYSKALPSSCSRCSTRQCRSLPVLKDYTKRWRLACRWRFVAPAYLETRRGQIILTRSVILHGMNSMDGVNAQNPSVLLLILNANVGLRTIEVDPPIKYQGDTTAFPQSTRGGGKASRVKAGSTSIFPTSHF